MRRDFITVLFVVVAAVIAGLMTHVDPKGFRAFPPAPEHSVTIATAPLIASAPVYVAKKRGFFQEEGISVEIRSLQSGTDCLNALLARKTQYATVGDMPAAVEGIRGSSTAIIATLATTDRDTCLIARRDHEISNLADLRGKIIAVAAREEGMYFLDTLLGMYGLSLKEVEVTGLPPPEMKTALAEGRIDAAVMHSPDAEMAARAIGENAAVFNGDGIYTMFWNLLTSREVIRRTPDLDHRLLRALARSAEYMEAHPAEARRITAEALGVPDDVVAAAWGNYLFDLTLDQALLAVLSDQARWAARRGLVPPDTKPNFLYFVSPEGLAAVRPRNVTIIR